MCLLVLSVTMNRDQQAMCAWPRWAEFGFTQHHPSQKSNCTALHCKVHDRIHQPQSSDSGFGPATPTHAPHTSRQKRKRGKERGRRCGRDVHLQTGYEGWLPCLLPCLVGWLVGIGVVPIGDKRGLDGNVTVYCTVSGWMQTVGFCASFFLFPSPPISTCQFRPVVRSLPAFSPFFLRSKFPAYRP